MPSLQELEDWIEGSIPSNIRSLPHNITETVCIYSEAVYQQLTKYGSPVNLPSLQEIEDHLPFGGGASKTGDQLASASTATPPHPPQGIWAKTTDWASRHKRAIQIGASILVIGFGTNSAYQRGHIWLPLLGRKQVIRGRYSIKNATATRQPLTSQAGTRKEAVVVIGADTPLGRALALHLASVGFIVIASVSSNAALSSFNSLIPPSSRGYIKALLFDTSDVGGALAKFIRSVDEVLKLRFPLLSAGDPYAAPGDQVNLVGVVNALSYVAPSYDTGITSQPTSSFHADPAELADAMEKHVVAPLSAIDALLPLLATAPRRSVQAEKKANTRGAKAGDDNDDDVVVYPASVLTLLSSPSSHTSLPGAGRESVIAQAAVAGMETMRREADVASSKERSALAASSRLTRPVSTKRPVRVATVEIDPGLPWGQAALPLGLGGGESTPSYESSQQRSNDTSSSRSSFTVSTAGTSSTGSATLTMRPSSQRKASATGGTNNWASRDESTQIVLTRVSSLLLPTNSHKRLRASYRVYLPNESERYLTGKAFSLFNRGTQWLMRIIPTGAVDVLLAMRRQVSLRRAGLVSQGPRPGQSGSSSGVLSQPPSLSSSATTTQGGPAAAQPSQSSTPLTNPPSSSASSDESRRGGGKGRGGPYHTRRGHGLGLDSGPPSLPDSNSGDSHGDVESEEDIGMVSSGVWSRSSDGHGARRTEEDEEDHTGPWVGPSAEEHHGEEEHDDEDEDEDASQGSMSASQQTSHVGDSWVALGESERGE